MASDSFSVTFGPSTHPVFDTGGSNLVARYATGGGPEFVSAAALDSALSGQLDSEVPGTSHTAVRPIRTPEEWQSYLDGAPAGTEFEVDLEVRFELDTEIRDVDAFDPFTLLWDVQGNPVDGRLSVDSTTTSLGRFLSGIIEVYLRQLAPGDFDGDPSQRMTLIANDLDRVTGFAENRQFQSAMDVFQSEVLGRMDGFYSGDPSDDYVVTLSGQQVMRPSVTEYMSKLRAAFLLEP